MTALGRLSGGPIGALKFLAMPAVVGSDGAPGRRRSASARCSTASLAVMLIGVTACVLNLADTARAEVYGLDLATAAFAADFDPGAYCGEGTCGPDVVYCKRRDASQVDCVVGFIDTQTSISDGSSDGASAAPPVEESRTCGLVVRVVQRGAQLFSGSYGCDGVLNPGGGATAARFVDFGAPVRLKRFRAGINWPASDEKNRYGVPHYDTKRELYTGASLPLTGTSVWAWLASALAMLAGGFCLRVIVRRGGSSPTPTPIPSRE